MGSSAVRVASGKRRMYDVLLMRSFRLGDFGQA
jgi:hypothetical protein